MKHNSQNLPLFSRKKSRKKSNFQNIFEAFKSPLPHTPVSDEIELRCNYLDHKVVPVLLTIPLDMLTLCLVRLPRRLASLCGCLRLHSDLWRGDINEIFYLVAHKMYKKGLFQLLCDQGFYVTHHIKTYHSSPEMKIKL